MAQVLFERSSESADGPSGHDSELAEDPSGHDSESAEEALKKATQGQRRWARRSHYVPPPLVPTSEEGKPIITPVSDR
jgi:hypothetical protein